MWEQLVTPIPVWILIVLWFMLCVLAVLHFNETTNVKIYKDKLIARERTITELELEIEKLKTDKLDNAL